MMGHRAKLSGSQWDAFSRRCRKVLKWTAGGKHLQKRIFARRLRREAREAAKKETTES